MKLANLALLILALILYPCTAFAKKQSTGIKRCHMQLFDSVGTLSTRVMRAKVVSQYCNDSLKHRPAISGNTNVNTKALCKILRNNDISNASFITYAMYLVKPKKIDQWARCIGNYSNKNPIGVSITTKFSDKHSSLFSLSITANNQNANEQLKLYKLSTINIKCKPLPRRSLPVDIAADNIPQSITYQCQWLDLNRKNALITAKIVKRKKIRLFELVPWFHHHTKYTLAFTTQSKPIINDAIHDNTKPKRNKDQIKLVVKELVPVKVRDGRLCGKPKIGYDYERACSRKENNEGLIGNRCYVTEVRLNKNLNPGTRKYWKLVGEPDLHCSRNTPCADNNSRLKFGKATFKNNYSGITSTVISTDKNTRFRLCSWAEQMKKKSRMVVKKIYPVEYTKDLRFEIKNGTQAELHATMNGTTFRIRKLGRSHRYLRRLYRETGPSGSVYYIYRPLKKGSNVSRLR